VKTPQKPEIVKPLSSERGTYESPRLKVFGPVGALTQSGSGMMDEMGMINMMGVLMCSDNIMRNMC